MWNAEREGEPGGAEALVPEKRGGHVVGSGDA
jgi:hypothetical protein